MLTNPQYYQGLLIVFEVFFGTLILSLPLGLLVAFARMSSFKPLSWLMQAFIAIMRGTPLLLQLIAVYYGLPTLNIVIDPMPSVMLAFVLNYAAYFAEIYRGGLLAIPMGQFEAARTLGFNRVTTYRRIILPQLVKRIMAPISNEIITLVKDTSLVYVLGIVDIMRVSQAEMIRTGSLTPLLYSGATYLVIIVVLTAVLQRIEKRLSYYR